MWNRANFSYTVDESESDRLLPAPSDDGLWRVNLENGQTELLVSLHRLLWTSPQPSMERATHWIDHVQPSRDGNRIAFLHRWMTGDGMFFSRLMVTDKDADDLVPLFAGGTERTGIQRPGRDRQRFAASTRQAG